MFLLSLFLGFVTGVGATAPVPRIEFQGPRAVSARVGPPHWTEQAEARVGSLDPRRVDSTALVQSDLAEDTIVYDDGVHGNWWISDRDSFGAAVRFTPRAYPCEVIGTQAEVNYDEGPSIFLRVYDDDGPNGRPGTLLYNERRNDIPHRTVPGFRDYDLTSPVLVTAGDFYICFWHRQVWSLVFGTDVSFDSVSRQWWYFPDQGWVTPYGLGLGDHMIRAKVRHGTGAGEETELCNASGFGIGPSILRRGGPLRCRLPAAGQVRLLVADELGREVFAQVLEGGPNGSAELILPELAAGFYVARITYPGGTLSRKLVVQH